MSEKLSSISISGRIILNMHSLNNEGNEGNQVLTRQATIVDQNGQPATVTAVSGDMLKHIMCEHFWNIATEDDLKLSKTSKTFNANRIVSGDISKKKSDSQSDITDDIKGLSWRMGESGLVTNPVITHILSNHNYSYSYQSVGLWLYYGTRECFLQDSDNFIDFINGTFPPKLMERLDLSTLELDNNSFIDGITHRQMRKHLLETFDDIYILDLHGNSKKKEKAPDGGKDKNVFDIQQGVAISIFIRIAGEKKGLGAVHHAEIYGERK